jgi:NADPH:quinone reductase-like Zn-dependent oxidoreductase
MEQAMRALRVSRFGGPEVIKMGQIECPVPQVGEVLVRVRAAALNPADWKLSAGLLQSPMITPPFTPGFDVAGVVEEIGPNVTGFQRGQAVIGWTRRGSFAEYTVVPAGVLAVAPANASFEEAATIPTGASTAWQGLFDNGNLQAGQRVLVQGAAGGVGQFAVRFAKWKDAYVIGTASTSNVELVRALGADEVIDYTATQIEDAVHDVDLVFDTVGNATLASSVQAVKRGGTLVTIAGVPSEEKVQERGINVKSFGVAVTSDLLRNFSQMVDDSVLRLLVGATFHLEDASRAYALCQGGHGRGRIVFTVSKY